MIENNKSIKNKNLKQPIELDIPKKFITSQIDMSKVDSYEYLLEKLDSQVDEFKDLIEQMYKSFPNGFHVGYVEEIIPEEKVRKELIKHGFLILNEDKRNVKSVIVDGEKYPVNKENGYMLGPNSLILINNWRIEKFTKQLIYLTYVLIILTIVTIILAYI